MWTIFSEKEEQQINSTITKGKKLSCTYKNYIWRGKNWKCLIYNVDNSYYRYYHYILCKGIHPKDYTYKMRSSQQCKYLELNGSNSREGKNAY